MGAVISEIPFGSHCSGTESPLPSLWHGVPEAMCPWSDWDQPPLEASCLPQPSASLNKLEALLVVPWASPEPELFANALNRIQQDLRTIAVLF